MDKLGIVKKLQNTPLDSSRLVGTLLTLEGQLRFRLGYRLAARRPVNRVDFAWPRGNLARVGVAAAARRRAKNSAPANFQEPYFSGVCARVRCLPVEELPCDAPIRPAGQCCDTCGAMATFRQSADASEGAVETVRAVEARLADRRVGISLARIDRYDYLPLYQLAVVSPAGGPYDESLCYAALADVLARLEEIFDGSARRVDLRISFSIQRGKIHWGKVLRYLALALAILLLATGAVYRQYRRSARLRLWLNDRWLATAVASNGPAAAWRCARDLVELRPTAATLNDPVDYIMETDRLFKRRLLQR